MSQFSFVFHFIPSQAGYNSAIMATSICFGLLPGCEKLNRGKGCRHGKEKTQALPHRSRIHADWVARCDCDHCHPRGDAAAGLRQSEAEGVSSQLHQ